MSKVDIRSGQVPTDGATGTTIMRIGAKYRQQSSSQHKKMGFYMILSAERKSAAPGAAQRNRHSNDKTL
eukprot:14218122-Ditylum_brightwellii.AAC.1